MGRIDELRIILLVSLTTVSFCSAANILILCSPLHSHLIGLVNVGEVLEQQGHNVTVAVPPGMQDQVLDRGLNVLLYHGIKDVKALTDETFKMVQHSFLNGQSFRHFLIRHMQTYSDLMLTGKQFYEDLQTAKPDLLILDSERAARFLGTVTCKLRIPFIVIGHIVQGQFARAPVLPTVVPDEVLGLTDHMTFLERLTNSITAVYIHFYYPDISRSLVSRYCPERPGARIQEIWSKASLWIEVHDGILDYNKPTMPNIKQVSNLLRAKPLKPIPPEFQTFMDNAKNGVVIVSFGSLQTSLPSEKLKTVLEAFRQTKYNFVIKHDRSIRGDSQFLFTKWMPQLELLCHNNTRLFITHCGSNGQEEAIYAGVPMIGFPVFSDQPHNAARIVRKGFGLRLDLRSFTVQELVNAIEEVITNPEYTVRTKKASAIVRAARVPPVEEAAFWIDHVLTFGDEHLRSLAQDVPLWKYLGLDIIAFCLLIWHLLLFVFIKIIYFVSSWCCGKKAKPKYE